MLHTKWYCIHCSKYGISDYGTRCLMNYNDVPSSHIIMITWERIVWRSLFKWSCLKFTKIQNTFISILNYKQNTFFSTIKYLIFYHLQWNLLRRIPRTFFLLGSDHRLLKTEHWTSLSIVQNFNDLCPMFRGFTVYSLWF